MQAPLPFFDTHFHLDPDDDPGAVIGSAHSCNVGLLLLASGDLADARHGVSVAHENEGVWCAAGVHPHEAVSFGGDIGPFHELSLRPEVVAIGEIGLDYHYDHSPRATQRRVFSRFLECAAQSGLPAVVHCREAYADCVAALRDCLPKGRPFEVHSFTGTPDQALEILDMGGYLGFNGMLTFRKAENIRESFAVVPWDRLLAETDSPYLAPVPKRGKRNRPEYLIHVLQRMAELRGVSAREAGHITAANGRRLFAVG